MTGTVFSHEMRVLCCANCGAPIRTAIQGGTMQCGYCHTVNQFAARDESAEESRSGPTMPESERWDRLRQQDGKPLLSPPDLQHLVVGGVVPAEQVEPARVEWQKSVEYARQAPTDFGNMERLQFLTVALNQGLGKELERRRAILETARDVTTDSNMRQRLHGMMSRLAAGAGDLESAEAWIALCDPYSLDLQADTQYRVAYAYLSIRRGDGHGVLQALGRSPQSVPIHDAFEGMCDVYRAAAFEVLGDSEEALRQLKALAEHEYVLVQRVVASALEDGIHLCPSAFQMVSESRDATQRATLHKLSRRAFGIECVVVGIVVPYISLMIVPVLHELDLNWRYGIGAAIALVVALVVALAGWCFWRHRKRTHLIRRGTKVPGRVEHLETTRYSHADTWCHVTVTLVLMPPGGESARLTTRGYRFEQELASLRRGWVEVLLDPAKPTEFLVL